MHCAQPDGSSEHATHISYIMLMPSWAIAQLAAYEVVTT